MSGRDVVITGLGILSPIGIGREAVWSSLVRGVSGIRPITQFDTRGLPVQFGGEVCDFDPKEFVKPRKSLKVMSRDIQFGVSVADMARADADLPAGSLDPDRFGVVFAADMIHCPLEDLEAAYRACTVAGTFEFDRWGQQALANMYPLWLLRYLPNMPACHIAIAQDARGPNNTMCSSEVSSLHAVAEGMRIIERGAADVMIVGGTSSRIHPTTYVRASIADVSRSGNNPEAASRPFDARRDGAVYGEGAAALVLESRAHAVSRGARIFGRVLAASNAFEPRSNGRPSTNGAIRRTIQQALRAAKLDAATIGHVNAHGLSTVADDRNEAQAIAALLGDVPVTAPKSYFGNLGAGTGAVEMVVSILALNEGLVPRTLNYEQPDPQCPVNVVRGEPATLRAGTALLLNQAGTGQAAAIVIAAEE